MEPSCRCCSQVESVPPGDPCWPLATPTPGLAPPTPADSALRDQSAGRGGWRGGGPSPQVPTELQSVGYVTHEEGEGLSQQGGRTSHTQSIPGGMEEGGREEGGRREGGREGGGREGGGREGGRGKGGVR